MRCDATESVFLRVDRRRAFQTKSYREKVIELLLDFLLLLLPDLFPFLFSGLFLVGWLLLVGLLPVPLLFAFLLLPVLACCD